MAVRLASDTIRTLYAIQCITKDVKHRSLSPIYKNKSQETCKVYTGRRRMSTKCSSTDSVPYDPSPSETTRQSQLKGDRPSENALVEKIHPDDRPQRNDVPERAECYELDDIMEKWNVNKPKK